MLRWLKNLFHEKHQTPDPILGASRDMFTIFDAQQQQLGLLRCLQAACDVSADRFAHFPKLHTNAVVSSKSHTGVRESAVEKRSRVVSEIVTGCVSCADSVLLKVLDTAPQQTADAFDVEAFSKLTAGIDRKRSALLISKGIWNQIVTRHVAFYDIYSESDKPDQHQHFGYLDGTHLISDAFMLTSNQTLTRAGDVAILIQFPIGIEINTKYTVSAPWPGNVVCEYTAECSAAIRIDPTSCRVFRLK